MGKQRVLHSFFPRKTQLLLPLLSIRMSWEREFVTESFSSTCQNYFCLSLPAPPHNYDKNGCWILFAWEKNRKPQQLLSAVERWRRTDKKWFLESRTLAKKKCNSVSPDIVLEQYFLLVTGKMENGNNVTSLSGKGKCVYRISQKKMPCIFAKQKLLHNQTTLSRVWSISFRKHPSLLPPYSSRQAEWECHVRKGEEGKESAIKCFFAIIVVGEMAVCERENSTIWPKRKANATEKERIFFLRRT